MAEARGVRKLRRQIMPQSRLWQSYVAKLCLCGVPLTPVHWSYRRPVFLFCDSFDSTSSATSRLLFLYFFDNPWTVLLPESQSSPIKYTLVGTTSEVAVLSDLIVSQLDSNFCHFLVDSDLMWTEF
jgi:hypothetical protein